MKKLQILIIAFLLSLSICAFSILQVQALPTVSLSPASSTLDLGQTVTFIPNVSSFSGSLSYQWFVNSVLQSESGSSFIFNPASPGSNSIYVMVTDSTGSAPSNMVTVTVNSALVAPTASASKAAVDQGQTSALSSTAVTTGTGPYTYGWFEKAPGATSYSSISGATSTSYSFVTTGSTATGSWTFILQATDKTGAAVNSSAVSVAVNVAGATYIVVSGFPNPAVAGVAHTFNVTVYNGYDHIVTNYAGTIKITSSDNKAVLPPNAGLIDGVGSFTVTLETAGSQSITATDNVNSSITGSQTGTTINAAGLNHFVFNSVGSQTAGSAFSIMITAEDSYGNTLTGYTGTPSLTVSAGSISPTTMNAFVSGIGSTSVTVNPAGSGVTITATDGTHTGTSNSFTVTALPTPTPTPTLSPSPTATPTPTPTSTSTPTPKPGPTPSPTPAPSATTVKATTSSGAIVDLAIGGNITSSQISNATITSNHANKTTMVSFTLTGPNGTVGFGNMTIPKTAIDYGTSPVVFIDGKQAPSQGYTQDTNNFYVSFSISFSTHQVSIQFVVPSTSLAKSLGPALAVGIAIVEIISVFTVIAVKRLRRKPENV